MRSRESWGHGDLHDLAELAAWSARELGAGFVLVNPLHAAEPVPPVSPSPYLPMTRLFTSPLYLRVEDIPEYAPPGRVAAGSDPAPGRPLRARNTSADLIDRDAVWTAKRAALELICKVPLQPAAPGRLRRLPRREGAELTYWSAWCALAEQHGPDWRTWPAPLRDRDQGLAQTAGTPGLRQAAEFHAWLQWQADEQLAAAQQAARDGGHGPRHHP